MPTRSRNRRAATRRSALDGLPAAPPEYGRAESWVATRSLSLPGRERPTKAGANWTTPSSQTRREVMGCPPGIAALRVAAAGSDKWSVFALAKESRSPLGAVETALPRDLGDAISVVSSMQERVCEFRRQRMSEFEEHAKLLEGYSSRLRALQSRHVAAAAGSGHVAV